ncbi:MAG: DegV family protein [Oscillospiraceae bacterium]|nr:DegV family protein [Oscillospiraceae bacterium]
MNIKILSDSTCDLSEALLKEHDITLVPLTVIKEGKEYKDGLTITPAEIFAHVANGGELCSTSANSVGEYQDIFAQYADKYDGILHINIGSGFSSCYQNANIAASEFENVKVVDSMNLSTGQGLVVLEACRLAKECASLDELHEKVQSFVEKVEASFLVDKLNYLAKGGRCSAVAALGANLLNLKPCIDVKDGKMGVSKKYRGKYAKCLSTYVQERLANRDDIRRDVLFVTKTSVEDEEYAAVMEAIREYGKFETVYETQAGCTVSCHCGPGTLGVLFVRK